MHIIATIAVPESMTANQVANSLSSSLGTAEDASTALGITVEELPTITITGDDPVTPSDMRHYGASTTHAIAQQLLRTVCGDDFVEEEDSTMGHRD